MYLKRLNKRLIEPINRRNKMARQKVNSNYGADSIQKLEDLEGIKY